MAAPQQNKPISFSEVKQAYTDFYLQQGVQPGTISATDAVLHLMSTAGELAAYAQGGVPLNSDFEKQEIHDVIGSLAISLSIIGDTFNVDPGDAALYRIQTLRRRANKVTSQGSVSNSQSSLPPTGANSTQRQLQPAARPPLQIDGQAEEVPAGPLSPNSANNFFPMLEVLEKNVPPEQIERMGLTWCVPGPGGKLVDLVPDGRNIPVTSGTWREFLDRCVPFRNNNDSAVAPPPHHPPATTNGGQGQGRPSSYADVTVSRETTPGMMPISLYQQQQQQYGGGNSPVQPNPIPVANQPPRAPAMTITPQRQQPDNVAVRTVTVNTTHHHYDPQEEAKLFSPSHFSRDLFSPHNAGTSFDVPYNVAELSPTSREDIYASTSTPQHLAQTPGGSAPVAPQVTLPPGLAMRQGGSGDAAATLPPALAKLQQQQQASSEAPLTQVAQPAGAAGGTPMQQASNGGGAAKVGANLDEAEIMFWDRFADIENGRISGADIASMGLFFVMPHNGQWIELMANGGSTPVTGNNAATFVSLLKNQQQQLHGRLRRAASMRTLAIKNLATYNPQEVADQFSPRHNEHGLFAPHTNTTTFVVDDGNTQEMLPQYLKQTMNQGFSNPLQYVEHISGKEAAFLSILEEIVQKPESVRKFKVTYCVPEQDGKVTDLIPDGRHKMVLPGDVPNYLAQVYKFFPDARR